MTKLIPSLAKLGELTLLQELFSLFPDAPAAALGFTARVRSFCKDVRHCDPAVDEEFRAAILQAANIYALQQKELARRLMVTPMTLQRWTQGKNLPYLTSRRTYLAEIALLGDEIAMCAENSCSKSKEHEKIAAGSKKNGRSQHLELVAG
jgi:hypothetical protein